MTAYTALRGILAPGTSVYGYHRGAPVAGQVVDAWGLVVGEANDPDADVVSGDLPAGELESVPLGRPTEADNRATWEAWAIANGMSEQDAAEVSQEDLEAVEAVPDAEPAAGQGDQPVRPADSAKKADWVAYAEARGADPAWAGADSTTKADLQAYEPPVGDTIAAAATEANQG